VYVREGGGGGATKKDIKVRKYHNRSVRSEDTCPLHVTTETDEDKPTKVNSFTVLRQSVRRMPMFFKRSFLFRPSCRALDEGPGVPRLRPKSTKNELAARWSSSAPRST
jgi:hypothetical protein